MNARNIAAQTLAKIAANDPRTIRPSEAVIQAWTEHFDIANITLDDALAAVTVIYREAPGRMPLASEVIAHAKRISTQRRSTLRSDLIAECPDCDECGWLLGEDRTVIDPATRCTHPTVVESSCA